MKKLALIIDPGHYPGYNPGIDPTVYEGNVMYSLAEAEKRYCDANYSEYVDCILTRGYNEDPALELGRGHKAVELKRSGNYEKVMFMSDHTNAPGGDPNRMTQKELEVYHNTRGVCIFTSQFRKNTYSFLQQLANVAGNVMGSKFLYLDAKAWKDVEPNRTDTADYWGVIRGAMNHARTQQEADRNGVDYAFIIEHGFHTNPVECDFFGNEANIQKMAQAKIDFIMQHFGIQKKQKITMTAFSYCDNTVTVVAERVEVYQDAQMRNVCGYYTKGTKVRAVQQFSLSDNRKGLRTEGDYYLSAIKGVEVTKNSMKPFVVAVNSPDGKLTLRNFPSSFEGDRVGEFSNGNLVRVVGECYNRGDHWYLVDQGDAPNKFSGFIAARYTKKA